MPSRRYFLRTAAGGLSAFLLLNNAYSQSRPPAGLHVLSSVLNPTTHKIAVELHNSSNKTAVAYSLMNRSLDVDGKEVQNSGIGWDFAGPEGSQQAFGQIKPGQTRSFELAAAPNAATAEISVLAVVYADRTYEGEAGPHFDSRAREAKAKREQALRAEGSRKK